MSPATRMDRSATSAGLAALIRDGMPMPYPLRHDDKPRAVFRPVVPPLVLDADEAAAVRAAVTARGLA